MSLNRCEQRIYDYWQSHRDERQYWQDKVRTIAKASLDDHEAAKRLDADLWRYYQERSAVAQPFKDAARFEGVQKMSMKNLAELILRLWTEPRPKKKKAEGEGLDGTVAPYA